MHPVMKIEHKPTAPKADCDILFVFQDGSKKPIAVKSPYKAMVEKLKKGSSFTASVGATLFAPLSGKGASKNVLLVGLGIESELTLEKARVAGAMAFSKLSAEKQQLANLLVDVLFEAKNKDAAIARLQAFTEGLSLSNYKFDKYKKKDSKKPDSGFSKLTLVSKTKDYKNDIAAVAKNTTSISECVNITRDWSNEPSNFGTPEFYANEAVKIAKAHGISCKVLNEKDAEKEKMGLFLSVGQGSDREGKIVVLDYHPKGADKTIALVGKGITFDSGGISIKPSLRMEEMKHDMTGAATLFGAMLLAVKRKVNKRIVTILAFTENMPGGDATQPGNVVYARNGKSVEIINTDAEGRLILADVLDYAQDFKPDFMINAATLTGAVVVALGKQCCGLMSNDPVGAAKLIEAGQETHERMWELPLFDEYFDDLKTDCADMKNSANDATGGTIRGGIFLKQFIRKGQKWAHLDIAATAYGMGHLPYYPKKGASGMHVRAVAQFIANY